MYWPQNFADAHAWFLSFPQDAPKWVLYDQEGYTKPVHPNDPTAPMLDSLPPPPGFPAPLPPPIYLPPLPPGAWYAEYVSQPPLPPPEAYLPHPPMPSRPPQRQNKKPIKPAPIVRADSVEDAARRDSAVSMTNAKLNPLAPEFVPDMLSC
ncbi:hypothetical protein HDU96_008829 [Phlyctochytrium bullatum]|nr:hypothetical protein HDU96_008829 [Phlyctochytrium bullatum]